MREIRGDMFSYLGRMKFRLFVTTNGTVRNDGYAVMGRGNAARAVTVCREVLNINLQDLVGKALKVRGNHINKITPQLYTFPVKYEWHDRARRRLIKQSVSELERIIKEDKNPELIYVVPRPGCGNGSLNWKKDVKPLMEHLPENVWVIAAWDDPQYAKERENKVEREHKVKHVSKKSGINRRKKSSVSSQRSKRRSKSR